MTTGATTRMHPPFCHKAKRDHQNIGIYLPFALRARPVVGNWSLQQYRFFRGVISGVTSRGQELSTPSHSTFESQPGVTGKAISEGGIAPPAMSEGQRKEDQFERWAKEAGIKAPKLRHEVFADALVGNLR